MEYLEKMLGVSVKYHRWKGELELPYYITERYYEMQRRNLINEMYFPMAQR